jgi:hypothetical protein
LVAQAFLGLFFMAAAYWKLRNYFLTGDQSLAGHWKYWEDSGWASGWILPLFHALAPYEKWAAALTILLQAVPGFLLLVHCRTRIAGFLLLFIQILIFVGTFHNLWFNEFVGLSLWIVLYFCVRPGDPGRWKRLAWYLFTIPLAFVLAIHLLNRYRMGDAWPSSLPWHIQHLSADVMSVSPSWKHFILWTAGIPGGAMLWASRWWLTLAFTVGLLLPLRRFSGALLLLLAIVRDWTWLNTTTSQGVLWVLALFLWLTQEMVLRERWGVRRATASSPGASGAGGSGG